MPRFASGNVLTGALVFATLVVVVSVLGVGAGELLFYLLYLVPTLVVLYLVVRWAVAAGVVDAGKRGAAVDRSGAREILDVRYARGEIGPEGYEEMRTRLETP